MANSLNYNGVALSAYGLVATSSSIGDFVQQYDSQLIQDISYGFKPKKPPKVISLDMAVVADNRVTLDSYLDSIKKVIVTETASALKLDTITDRYWNAKLTTFGGGYQASGLFVGVMVFQADDPMAYDNDETSRTVDIDADPDTIVEPAAGVVGGTGYINPVYTLTAGNALGPVTIKLENITTDEELQWTGSLASGEELEIDVANWIVKKEHIADMSTVTGQFPRLAPGVANSIKVTAFHTAPHGSLNIKYRNRFL